MSTIENDDSDGGGIDLPDHEQKRKETLDRLYEMREDLKTAADSNTEYAQYARNGLQTLQGEGYDVDY
jgi:hypothetical protein